ncbi:MAG: hypothetical protein JW881_00170 [Spirochaetales bacterium]|nr:hypothetical protein [Spirochaetales bacterium]
MKKMILIAVCSFAILPLQAQERDRTIAVLEVVGEGVDATETSLVYEYIVDRMNRSRTYILVERAALDRALEEMELSASDIVDENTASKLGKVTGAGFILITSLIKTGEQYHLSMRVVNVETSTIENTAIEKTSDFSAIDVLTRRAVEKLFNLGFNETGRKASYLNITAGGGLCIPVGDVGRVFTLGYTGLLHCSWNMKLGPGYLGLGFLTGAVVEPTRSKDDPESEVVYEYTLLAFPAFGVVQYHLHFGRFYAGCEVNPGVLLSIALFSDADEGETSLTPVAAFSGGLYGGYTLTETIGLFVRLDYLHGFYTGAPYTGLAAGAGIEISF